MKRHLHPAARRARPLVLLPGAALAACLGVVVQAQPAPSGEPATLLPAVRVTGTGETATSPVDGYVATRSATATKTDTPLSETPQAITVIPREQIVDQGAQNIQDAMNYAAGVRPNAYGVENSGDYVRIRGVEPVQYLDGLRQFFSPNNPRTEVYAMERVEVLRGPSSMLYGQGSTGGIVNLVSKRPLEETQREIGVVLGNHNRREIQADLTGPASEDGQWLYRVIAVGLDSDSQTQYAPDDRLMLAPSLTWRPSAATSLTLQATWQKERSGTTQATLPWNGTVQENPNGRIPTRRFGSEPGFDAYDTELFRVGWLFEHQFNETWKLRQSFRNAVSSVDYKAVYPNVYGALRGNSYIDPEQTTVDRSFYVDKPRKRTLQVDQNLEGKLNWGRTEHTVIFGMDYSRYRETTQTAGGAGSPLNLYHPVYGNVPEYELSDGPKINQQQIGFYAQDQIKFDKNWIFLAGIRRDRADSTTAGQDRETDMATTKRFGLMYAADNGWSPYLSYSESFTPVAGADFYNQHWKPMRAKQVEAGIKYMPKDADIEFTAAAYDLREKNRQTDDPDNPNNQLQAGKTHTRGVELELRSRVTKGVDVIANYIYTDLDPQLDAQPKHMASMWGKYRFALAGQPGFAVGAGVRYLSAFGDGGAPETPAVTLFDAMLSYDNGPWRYALNVNNIADRTYEAICMDRGDCYYGARRTVMLSGAYRF